MSSNSTISISFKVEDGTNGLKALTIDAQGLSKALRSDMTEAERLKSSLATMSSISVGIGQLQGVVQGFQSALKGLTDAYAVQIQAETQLENSMRNTMSATDAEIQSIKDLCSAQQQLGVIGDEVQLAGAQKLATFLSEKNSLAALIPVMNDVVAKQNGFNATGENAATVAAAIGKAISGQTAALGKMGISFSDAQKEVLKYGNEQERVALLVDVISAKVGGQNQALAQIPFGAVKQLSNWLGDVKEQLGSIAVKIQPALDMSASATIAVGGITKLVMGINALNKAMKAATVTAKVLNITLKSLLAVGVVGIVLYGLSEILKLLSNKSDEARKKTEELAQAQARYATEVRDISDKIGKYSDTEISRLDRLYKSATDETKSRKERIKAAKELQSIYPDYFRDMSAEDIALGKAKKGYDELTNSIMKNARVKAAADKIVENEAQASSLKRERDKLEAERQALYKKVAAVQQKYDDASARSKADHSPLPENLIREGVVLNGNNTITTQADSDASRYRKELTSLQEQARNTSAEIANLNQKISDTYKANDDLKADYGVTDDDLNAASGFRPISFLPESPETDKQKTRLQELNEEIEKLRNAYISANDSERLSIMSKVSALDKEKEEIEGLLKTFDERGSFDFTVDMSNAQFEIEEGGIDGLAERLNTIKDLNDAIDVLKQKQQNASIEEIAGYQETINVLEKKLSTYEKLTEKAKLPFNSNASTLKDISNNIDILNEQLQSASIEEAAVLNQEIEKWNEKADAIRNAGKAGGTIGEAFGALGSSLSSIGGLLDETTQKWVSYVGQVLQSIPQLIQAITALAASKAAASAAETPIVGWLMVGAAIASTLGAMAAIPKFADGGIISGPTFGLIGEYAGASNNPEVVAPLDKLRGMLQPVDGIGGTVKFKIDGRTLVGILERETNLKRRS